MLQIRRKKPMMKFDFRSCDIISLRMVIGVLVILSSLNLTLSSSSHSAKYSAPLNNTSDDDFKPIFLTHVHSGLISKQLEVNTAPKPLQSEQQSHRKEQNKTQEFKTTAEKYKETAEDSLGDALKEGLTKIEKMLSSYIDGLFAKKKIEKYGISMEFEDSKKDETTTERSLEGNFERLVRSTVVKIPLEPRGAETGRLFFFAGLKKILWPLFIGIQIVKSLIFALFLPSIIGSIGKIASQGSSSLAGFNKPSETVNDLNFKDNFEDDSKFTIMDNGAYAYNQPDASVNHFSTQLYDSAAINNNALSRFGMNENRDNYLNTFGYDENKKANLNPDSPSLTQLYQSFKKLPTSSLVLSNYDPFYSPLLSRLDAIFEQLGLKSKDENCREKLICFMYADPQKYAPYSNLVSAQLSRELDELRKPSSENPEILRFFRYMKAAKDGQDGENCDETYSMCEDFKDLDNPAMINAFHDINKLVEARKLHK